MNQEETSKTVGEIGARVGLCGKRSRTEFLY